MFRSTSPLTVVLSLFACATADVGAEGYAGVGRLALPEEIRAWNIDVRPDFEGLPRGSGGVARGQKLWEQQCASCHGIFGESTNVYRPIVGGTTAQDMKTGRAATLASDAPLITTLSKLSTVSTLWDYIRRAMPWTAPKTLHTDDVYALVAYILHLGDIVPADYVLSDSNIGDVQAVLPNRRGAVPFLPLWELRGEPDVRNVACMKSCPTGGHIISEFPEEALSAHGSPADQHRAWGPVRGVSIAAQTEGQQNPDLASGEIDDHATTSEQLAQKAGCFVCHAVERAGIGPAFAQIAARYKADDRARGRLFESVRTGSSGRWGAVAMPPQQIGEEPLIAIIDWLLAGAGSK